MSWWQELQASLGDSLAGLQVGVYGSGGAPYHHLALAALLGADPRPVRSEDIAAGVLADLDVLIFPGGGFSAMAGMLTPLGTDGAQLVNDWVAAGGMYLGSCAGSFLPVNVGEGYWQAHEEARVLHMVDADLANGSDSIFEGLSSPGVGTIKAQVVQDHWLSEGLPRAFEIVHYNGPLFALETRKREAPWGQPCGVIQPTAATDNFTPSEGFMGPAESPTLLERCIDRGAFNGIVTPYGEGVVVLFGSHPEFGNDVLQLGWLPAVRLLANALQHQAQQRKSKLPPAVEHDQTEVLKQLASCAARLEQIALSFEQLKKAEVDAWFKPPMPSFLGRSARQIWLEATVRAAEVAQSTASMLARLTQAPRLAGLQPWLDNPPRDNQDVGFMGLEQLTTVIAEQLELSQRQLKQAPIVLEHAYDGFGHHPYQIAASSYLSAAGLTAAAHLATVTMAKLTQQDALIAYDDLLA